MAVEFPVGHVGDDQPSVVDRHACPAAGRERERVVGQLAAVLQRRQRVGVHLHVAPFVHVRQLVHRYLLHDIKIGLARQALRLLALREGGKADGEELRGRGRAQAVVLFEQPRGARRAVAVVEIAVAPGVVGAAVVSGVYPPQLHEVLTSLPFRTLVVRPHRRRDGYRHVRHQVFPGVQRRLPQQAVFQLRHHRRHVGVPRTAVCPAQCPHHRGQSPVGQHQAGRRRADVGAVVHLQRITDEKRIHELVLLCGIFADEGIGQPRKRREVLRGVGKEMARGGGCALQQCHGERLRLLAVGPEHKLQVVHGLASVGGEHGVRMQVVGGSGEGGIDAGGVGVAEIDGEGSGLLASHAGGHHLVGGGLLQRT